MKYQTVVHIADVPQAEKQFCLRCGELLIDNTNILCAVTESPHYWQHGDFVGMTFYDSESLSRTVPMSFLMPRDAGLFGEKKCRVGS
jgi:hypothetical protein